MKIRVTVLSLALGVLFCVPLAFSQDAAPKKAKMDPNKPAGEQFKNVQILKDVPSGQFIGYMRSFNASLGVECNFCHVQDRSSDEKEEKKTARQMLTMTHEINQKFFAGKMEVRCFTCHRGSEHPVSEAPGAGATSEKK